MNVASKRKISFDSYTEYILRFVEMLYTILLLNISTIAVNKIAVLKVGTSNHSLLMAIFSILEVFRVFLTASEVTKAAFCGDMIAYTGSLREDSTKHMKKVRVLGLGNMVVACIAMLTLLSYINGVLHIAGKEDIYMQILNDVSSDIVFYVELAYSLLVVLEIVLTTVESIGRMQGIIKIENSTGLKVSYKEHGREDVQSLGAMSVIIRRSRKTGQGESESNEESQRGVFLEAYDHRLRTLKRLRTYIGEDLTNNSDGFITVVDMLNIDGLEAELEKHIMGL